MESPVSAQDDGFSVKAEEKSNCGQSCAATFGLGGQFLCIGENSVVVLDSGATAN